VRITPRVRACVAAAGLLVATLAGCSTTVDGVATCPGCGTGTEPEFPTTRPTPVPPSQSESPTPQPPSGGETLSPNEAGYVYIETKSGKTRCQLSAESVGCEADFADAPTVGGEQATGVEVSASGDNRWVVGNLGAIPTVTIDYATYSAVGWTIDADPSGTLFTNDDTGHGMFVSTEKVDFF
jgi:hypothetical protein